MENIEEKIRKMEEDKRKMEEFSKTWIGRKNQSSKNHKEIEQFKKWSVLFR